LYKRFDINKAPSFIPFLTVKFHTQFEEKTVVPNPSDILN